ncbi:MAG: TspO/MBR family protein [Candidatus Nanopelagicales bacterium]
MLTSRIAFSLLTIIMTLIYAFGSGFWVNSGNAFYRALKRPIWQPPDYVFGLIWPYNFLILIIISASVISAGTLLQKNIWIIFYAISIAAALTWARMFYVSENLIISAVALAIAALATLPMTYLAWKLQLWAGVAILPYQIWLIVATSLSFGYSYLNSN